VISPPVLSSRAGASDDEGMHLRPPSWLGWPVAAASAGLAVAFLAGNAGAGRGLPVLDTNFGPNVVAALTLPWVGAVIVSRRPGHPMGWLFCTVGLACGVTLGAYYYAQYAVVEHPGSLPWAVAVAWVSAWIWVCGFVPLVTFGVLLFPDGHLPSPRWRPVGWVAAAAILLGVVGGMFQPGNLANHPVTNPVGIPGAGPVFDLVDPVFVGLVVLAALSSLASLAARWRRARAVERQQLTLFLLAVAVMIAAVFSPWGDQQQPVAVVVSVVALAMIPVSVGVAIVRHRLYDIDIVVNRSLLYAGLTAGVVTVSAAVVAVLGLLIPDSVGLSVLGTAVAVAVVLPLRDRVQRLVNRMTYGDRDDPYAAVSRLSQRLADAVGPQQMLQSIVDTVVQALRLRYAAVHAEREDTVAVHAQAGTSGGTPALSLPLTHQGQPVGRLIVELRPDRQRLDDRERALLEELARQAGVAVHAVRLTADLQASREQLVTAREEERRRLRRDLHDGLGPTLAGVALGLDVAIGALDRDPEEAKTLLRDLKAETAASIADVRRIVYDLRPPALDELGLVSALRQQADRVNLRDGQVTISVQAPDILPPLPAAVEVAAYRIGMEALTNAARHAHARHCRLRLTLDDRLEIEVTDDGIGPPTRGDSGVGLAAMRERAAELGGTCTIDGTPGAGTRVLARLPVQRR
jgi:signal transduction histidine kinase